MTGRGGTLQQSQTRRPGRAAPGPRPQPPEEVTPLARRGPTTPYVLLLPAAAALLLALGYPLVRQVILSSQEFGLAQQFGADPSWVGLDNYAALVTDSYLWTVVARTVAFCLVNAFLTAAIGLGVALLMRAMSTPVRLAVQVAMLLAWAMPVIAALTVWQFLFDTQYGVINWLLDSRGHSWLLNPWSFFAVATIVVVWMSVPFVAFTLYAALTGVPEELLEAAEIDGAGRGSLLRHVMLPAIRPVLLVVLLLQVIWDLRVFAQIYNLQEAGGITKETNLLGTYIYSLGIKGGDFGAAASAAIFMLLLTVVLTAPYVHRMLRQERQS